MSAVIIMAVYSSLLCSKCWALLGSLLHPAQQGEFGVCSALNKWLRKTLWQALGTKSWFSVHNLVGAWSGGWMGYRSTALKTWENIPTLGLETHTALLERNNVSIPREGRGHFRRAPGHHGRSPVVGRKAGSDPSPWLGAGGRCRRDSAGE